ncbi:MAG: hypothetical protein M0Z39_07450 [Actinomycetota bacterium]|nr:hypothetical protein [Actinomycetota bacterium]
MTIGNRNWAFGAEDKNGRLVTLVKASDTPIVRHAKIKGDANAFDPSGKPTLRTESVVKWPQTFRTVRSWHSIRVTSMETVRDVAKRSHPNRDGRLKTSFPVHAGDLTRFPIGFSSTKAATGPFMTNVWELYNRVPKGTFKRLEADALQSGS